MKPRDDFDEVLPFPDPLKELTFEYLGADVQLPLYKTPLTLFKRTANQLAEMQANRAATLLWSGEEAEEKTAFQLATASPIIMRSAINFTDSIGRKIQAKHLIEFLAITDHVTFIFVNDDILSSGMLERFISSPDNSLSLEEKYNCLTNVISKTSQNIQQPFIQNILNYFEKFGNDLIQLDKDKDCQPLVNELDNELKLSFEQTPSNVDLRLFNKIAVAVIETLLVLLKHEKLEFDWKMENRIKLDSQSVSKHIALISICVQRIYSMLHPRDARLIYQRISRLWPDKDLCNEEGHSLLRLEHYLTALGSKFGELIQCKEVYFTHLYENISKQYKLNNEKRKVDCTLS